MSLEPFINYAELEEGLFCSRILYFISPSSDVCLQFRTTGVPDLRTRVSKETCAVNPEDRSVRIRPALRGDRRLADLHTTASRIKKKIGFLVIIASAPVSSRSSKLSVLEMLEPPASSRATWQCKCVARKVSGLSGDRLDAKNGKISA